jgi:chorismate synthase
MLGGIIDGCPPGITIDLDATKLKCQEETRSISDIVTQRKESQMMFNFFQGF